MACFSTSSAAAAAAAWVAEHCQGDGCGPFLTLPPGVQLAAGGLTAPGAVQWVKVPDRLRFVRHMLGLYGSASLFQAIFPERLVLKPWACG